MVPADAAADISVGDPFDPQHRDVLALLERQPRSSLTPKRIKSAIVLAISGILKPQELRRRPRQPPPARRVDASSCHDWCHVEKYPDNACLPGLSFQASSFHIIQLAERVRSWLQPPGCLPGAPLGRTYEPPQRVNQTYRRLTR